MDHFTQHYQNLWSHVQSLGRENDVQIYFSAILPRPEVGKLRKNQKARANCVREHVNEMIQDCHFPGLTFVPYPEFEGRPDLFGADGLHVNGVGAGILARKFRNIVIDHEAGEVSEMETS